MADKDSGDEFKTQISSLKQLFEFGGELMPFIEELYGFLKDIIPLIEDMTGSLKETSDTMPKAQERIDKVTEATLLATTQIMDRLDHINSLCDKITNNEKDENNKKMLEEIQNDSMDIINSLQFQDITSQKLGHVRNMLDSVHERFGKLFDRIDNMKINDSMKEQLFGNRLKEHKGDIFEAGEDHIRTEGISQNDIDVLFD